MNRIENIRQKLEQQKGKRSEVQRSISHLLQQIRDGRRSRLWHEQALEIVKTVGLATQEQLQFHIGNITSLALEVVSDDPYELVAEFVERRNKTECDLWFVRNNERMKPIESTGGGTIDVAAFALRVASWSMQTPRSRNVMILDEPFKCLKGIEANRRVLDMIKEISDKLNLQIIMVSDERIPRENIIERADRVFEVTIHKGISKVTQL